jgi:hypothetical protein
VTHSALNNQSEMKYDMRGGGGRRRRRRRREDERQFVA